MTTGGKRVELNAMASDVFIAFVERKLRLTAWARWCRPDMLAETYAAFKRGARPRRRWKANWLASTPSRSRSPPILSAGCAPI